MTVALVGVAADTTNVEPVPTIEDDGRFDYVPIPEPYRERTTETRTYGNEQLRTSGRPIADVLDTITPRKDGPTYEGEELASWPIHYDPNFEALTYGERRGPYRKQLRKLDEGDVVAFYTGLRGLDGGPLHRYLIGLFTVDSVVEFESLIETDELPLDDSGDRIRVDSLPRSDRERIEARLADRPENAHVKRYRETGKLDRNLRIVEGCSPGGLLDRAVPISRHDGGGHHYLTHEWEATFDVQTTSPDNDTGYLGGLKKAHELDISAERFRKAIEGMSVGPTMQ